MLESSGNFEEVDVLNITSKQSYQGYLQMLMLPFHANYEFDSKQKFGETLKFENTKPTEDEIYLYVKYVVLSSKMEKEIPIMALIYIE